MCILYYPVLLQWDPRAGEDRDKAFRATRTSKAQTFTFGALGLWQMSTKLVAFWVHHMPNSSGSQVLASLSSLPAGSGIRETEIQMPSLCLTGCVTHGR